MRELLCTLCGKRPATIVSNAPREWAERWRDGCVERGTRIPEHVRRRLADEPELCKPCEDRLWSS